MRPLNPELHGTAQRESIFWDKTADGREAEALDPSSDKDLRVALAFLGELGGRRVLDVCCGMGGLSVLCARLGARVVGCDVSARALEVGRSLAARHGVDRQVEFVQHSAETPMPDWRGGFDVVVGRYALHHLDLAVTLPNLRAYLRPGGRCSFIETSALNPVLRFARTHLVGRCGIPRYGTTDEHPLALSDIRLVGQHLGGCRLATGTYDFMRILDRQVFHYRVPAISRLCAFLDDTVFSALAPNGSFHVVLICGPLPQSRGTAFHAGASS